MTEEMGLQMFPKNRYWRRPCSSGSVAQLQNSSVQGRSIDNQRQKQRSRWAWTSPHQALRWLSTHEIHSSHTILLAYPAQRMDNAHCSKRSRRIAALGLVDSVIQNINKFSTSRFYRTTCTHLGVTAIVTISLLTVTNPECRNQSDKLTFR